MKQRKAEIGTIGSNWGNKGWNWNNWFQLGKQGLELEQLVPIGETRAGIGTIGETRAENGMVKYLFGSTVDNSITSHVNFQTIFYFCSNLHRLFSVTWQHQTCDSQCDGPWIGISTGDCNDVIRSIFY